MEFILILLFISLGNIISFQFKTKKMKENIVFTKIYFQIIKPFHLTLHVLGMEKNMLMLHLVKLILRKKIYIHFLNLNMVILKQTY